MMAAPNTPGEHDCQVDPDGVFVSGPLQANPHPLRVGLNASPKAATKCLRGKMLPSASIHAGVSSVTMKTSDTKASGRSVALATAGALSPFGTSAATIKPRAAKAAAPTTNVTSAATSVDPLISTPYTIDPDRHHDDDRNQGNPHRRADPAGDVRATAEAASPGSS